MSRNDKFKHSFKQFLNHHFGLYSKTIYDTCQKLNYQDNRGSFHQYSFHIPSKYFHILDPCYSEPDGDNYTDSLSLLAYGIEHVNNAEMHKKIVKKLKIAAGLKKILTTFYEPFTTSSQNCVHIGYRNVNPKNYCREYDFNPISVSTSDNNVYHLKHILQHWLTENHSIRSDDSMYECISMDHADAMLFDDTTNNLYFHVYVSYTNGHNLPFPITFSLEDTIKQLKDENLYLNQKYRSMRNEIVSMESSFQRRIRRLNNGIREKEEKYNHDVTALLKKSANDNVNLTNKIREYYSHGKEEQCSVCFDPIKTSDLYVPPCCHFLCNDCAEGCIKLNGKCPLCRELIYKEKDDNQILNNTEDDGISL
jgi:hypothetical protein